MPPKVPLDFRDPLHHFYETTLHYNNAKNTIFSRDFNVLRMILNFVMVPGRGLEPPRGFPH